jgi:uncharacterized damage-inducible protein DinB
MHAHRRWADARALEAGRALSDAQLRQQFPIGQGTVLATLTHLYAAELVWMETFDGNPNPPSPFDIKMESLAALEPAWRELDARWVRFLDGLTDADLARPVTKRAPDGRMYTTAGVDVHLHMCLHANYTLAQLTNMLRHLGVPPLPQFMMITMAREEAGAGK